MDFIFLSRPNPH